MFKTFIPHKDMQHSNATQFQGTEGRVLVVSECSLLAGHELGKNNVYLFLGVTGTEGGGAIVKRSSEGNGA